MKIFSSAIFLSVLFFCFSCKNEITYTPINPVDPVIFPDAGFEYLQKNVNPEGSTEGYKIEFINTSTDATAQKWKVYDYSYYSSTRSDTTGTDINFGYLFLCPGEYDVSLDVSNAEYSDFESKTITVEGQTAKFTEGNNTDYGIYTDFEYVSVKIYKTETDYINDTNEIAVFYFDPVSGYEHYITNLLETNTYYYRATALANGQIWQNTQNNFTPVKNSITYINTFLQPI